jgi:hypothetical protein
MGLIKIRGINNYSTIEQVFECPVEAMHKYKEYAKLGWAVEYVNLTEDNRESYARNVINEIKEKFGVE